MKGIVGQVQPAFNMDDVLRSALDEVLANLGLNWDAAISCEMIGVYKPKAEAYFEALADTLDL